MPLTPGHDPDAGFESADVGFLQTISFDVNPILTLSMVFSIVAEADVLILAGPPGFAWPWWLSSCVLNGSWS